MGHLDARRCSGGRVHLSAMLALVLAACGGEEGSAAPPAAALPSGTEDVVVPMTLTSTAFAAGGPIPTRHTGEGPDLSPPLDWHGVAEGTRQLVLICDDPDAPRPTPWVHWVLYGLSPRLEGLAEGDPAGGVEGTNDFGRTGWGGPMPPRGHGIHHYRFRLYALDTDEPWPPGLRKEAVLARLEGHVLQQAELVGTYER